jgi:lipopolysaccharide assembly protein A
VLTGVRNRVRARSAPSARRPDPMRVLLAIPLMVILVVFALSNKQVVRLGLWPTDVVIDVPVSLAVLGIAGLFFLFGALVVWTGALAERSRARRAEATVRQLEAQLAAMRSRPALSLPPPG